MTKTAQIFQAFFRIPCLSGTVNSNQAEGHGKTFLPFEVVQQAPVTIALHRDTVIDTALHTGQRPTDEFDAAAIICGCDAVFSDDNITLKFLVDGPDYISQSLGIEFVTHLGQLRVLRKIDLSEETEAASGIILDTDKIVILNVGSVAAYRAGTGTGQFSNADKLLS